MGFQFSTREGLTERATSERKLKRSEEASPADGERRVLRREQSASAKALREQHV